MNLYHPVKIGALELPGNLFIAPVAGYTDRGFRSLCAGYGADFGFTELVSAEALYRKPGHYGLEDMPASAAAQENPGTAKALRQMPVSFNLVRRGENEKRYAIQLFAADPDVIYKAAILLAPLCPDALDINAGCPVPKVTKNGAGSALMKNPDLLGRVVEAAVQASRQTLGGIPVTIKMRSGWDHSSINYIECARIAAEAGAAMVSLHPRTRSQNYEGTSNWAHIKDLASRLSIPVTGSGDLYTPEDAKRMLEETGCAAVMFARGAMGNPFIFSETRMLLETGSWQPTLYSQRIEAAFRHLELLATDIGERLACLEMRKQFCAYTKGIPKSASLRDKLVHSQSIAEYREIFGNL